MLFFVSQKSVCFAEATGKIKAASVKVRQSADTNSEVIGSSSLGKTVTLISQTTDASGYVWYEVYVDANTTGYIRSDLVDVDSSSGTIPTSSSAAPAQSSEQPTSTASGAEILPETGMDAQYATIKVRSANVRSAASTKKSVVGSLPQNTQVVVTGQTEGTDKTWYYITFTGTNGEEKTGYVRSDMITLGEMVPVEEPQEEEPQEEPEAQDTEPEITVNQDYELRYEYSEALGEDVWYIYDWTDPDPNKGTKQNLEDVLAAAHAQSLNNVADPGTVSKQRIVIIVLIAVIIILAVVMTIMIFKLRDAYYEEYEDDEDEEEEDRRKKERRKEAEETKRSESRSSSGKSERRREREEREEREEPVRRKSSSAREERQPAPRKKSAETDRRMPEREVSYEEEDVEPVKAAPKKKAKNFMIDDDDFEFEFLNMKNKDKDI